MGDYALIRVPEGDRITADASGNLRVPRNPIIGYMEGDGIGPDIWRAAMPVFDAAVAHCFGDEKRVAWMQLPVGERANAELGTWLPEEVLDAVREFRIAIKGPLRTPVGGGHRSINVTLRQQLDLFACVRPIRYFAGLPSPVRRPDKTNMVIFRENTEDVYAGMEFPSGDPVLEELRVFLKTRMNWDIRPDAGLGLKPMSEMGTKRLVRAAINYAVATGRKSVTLVHKGNIMKYTEGSFRRWGYDVARQEFPDITVCAEEGKLPADAENKIVIKDVIADSFLQLILLTPEEFDVIATPNLNGDYISDALAAQVGGLGIAPGANINYETGTAIFEPTHGVAPAFAGLNKANPSGLILSGAMMFRYIGWPEVADTILQTLRLTIADRTVTHDFARSMDDAVELTCTDFGQALVRNLSRVKFMPGTG